MRQGFPDQAEETSAKPMPTVGCFPALSFALNDSQVSFESLLYNLPAQSASGEPDLRLLVQGKVLKRMGFWCWVTCRPSGNEDPSRVEGGVDSPGAWLAGAVHLLSPSPVVTWDQM